MTMHTKLYAALVLAGLATAQAWAVGPRTASVAVAPTSSQINMTNACAGGGTRAVAGSYNAATGALNTTTTLAACVARNGDRFDGTTGTAGTLLAIGTGFTIDITATINTTVTRADGSTVTRACSTRKAGTFTTATQTFDGSTTQTACSVTGRVLEHEGLVEHLLRPATGGEDGGAPEPMQRMLPPQVGEDLIRQMPHVTPYQAGAPMYGAPTGGGYQRPMGPGVR